MSDRVSGVRISRPKGVDTVEVWFEGECVLSWDARLQLFLRRDPVLAPIVETLQAYAVEEGWTDE